MPSPTRCALSTGFWNAKNYTLPRRQASSPAPVVCQNSPLPDLSLTRHLHFCPKHGSLKTPLFLYSIFAHTLFLCSCLIRFILCDLAQIPSTLRSLPCPPIQDYVPLNPSNGPQVLPCHSKYGSVIKACLF